MCVSVVTPMSTSDVAEASQFSAVPAHSSAAVL